MHDNLTVAHKVREEQQMVTLGLVMAVCCLLFDCLVYVCATNNVLDKLQSQKNVLTRHNARAHTQRKASREVTRYRSLRRLDPKRLSEKLTS